MTHAEIVYAETLADLILAVNGLDENGEELTHEGQLQKEFEGEVIPSGLL